MINTEVIRDIFHAYSIKKVIFIEEESFNTFIICSMQEILPIERWNNLENVLSEYTNKKINLFPLLQANKYLDEEYINKGVIIQ
jgi:hypothetical protein